MHPATSQGYHISHWMTVIGSPSARLFAFRNLFQAWRRGRLRDEVVAYGQCQTEAAFGVRRLEVMM